MPTRGAFGPGLGPGAAGRGAGAGRGPAEPGVGAGRPPSRGGASRRPASRGGASRRPTSREGASRRPISRGTASRRPPPVAGAAGPGVGEADAGAAGAAEAAAAGTDPGETDAGDAVGAAGAGPGRGAPGRGAAGPGVGAADCWGRRSPGPGRGPGLAPLGRAEPLPEAPSDFDGNDSRRRRATGASTVDDADLTNSPCSFSRARSSLLVTPSSLANSCTRALPATALLTGRSQGSGSPHDLGLSPMDVHRRCFTVCSSVRLPVLVVGGIRCSSRVGRCGEHPVEFPRVHVTDHS